MQKINTLSNTWKLVICIFICQSVGIVSAFVTSAQNNIWFDNLIKPSWNPPSYLFGPVWTFLYLLMAISLWIIWKSDTDEIIKNQACLIFALQLFLNFWWSILFFNLHSPEFAFFDIVLMIIVIITTMFRFSRISTIAAWLLVPYISWVCFAAILNFKLIQLNN